MSGDVRTQQNSAAFLTSSLDMRPPTTLQDRRSTNGRKEQPKLRIKLPLDPDLHAAQSTGPSSKDEDELHTASNSGWLHMCSIPSWIKDNFHRSKFKTVVRSAVASWVSILLMIIPRTQRVLGAVRHSITSTLARPDTSTSYREASLFLSVCMGRMFLQCKMFIKRS